MRIVVVLLVVLAIPSVAVADDPARALSQAQEQLLAGEYSRAAALAGPYTSGDVSPPTRAEANRIYGLALFQLGLRAEAERALLAYLVLEPDAHLDPALVPPEALVFFEDVRARHAGELIRRKPRPKPRRSWLLNLVPPLGQFQNGHRTKAWLLGGAEVVLLAANLGSYVALTSMCDDDLTCDDSDTAHVLKTVNLAAGLAFAGLYLVGVYDGFRGSSRPLASEGRALIVPTVEGALFVWGGRF